MADAGDCSQFSAGADDDDWEICNQNGFVYKRRRRPPDAAGSHSPPPPAEDSEAELRKRRRDQRRHCLLNLRDKYQRELDHWERLSSTLLDLAAPPPPAPPESTATAAAGPSVSSELPEPQDGDRYRGIIDELVAQAEAQDTILRKISEMCDYVDFVCEEKEGSLVESLMALPIWGNPAELVTSLQDDCEDRRTHPL